MKERLVALGYDVVASTPEEFRTRITAEIENLGVVVRDPATGDDPASFPHNRGGRGLAPRPPFAYPG